MTLTVRGIGNRGRSAAATALPAEAARLEHNRGILKTRIIGTA